MDSNKPQDNGMRELSTFFYLRGKINKTLFIRKFHNDIILVEVYVDNIIFGVINGFLCEEFALVMQGKFEMSLIGEFT